MHERDSSPGPVASRPPAVLVAGGGSGGHVYPGLALAEELRRRGCPVSFAGSPAGMEARIVPSRGFAFHPLPARPFLGRGPLARARALGVLGSSVLAARRLIRRQGFDAVVGTGGYVSAPAVVAARSLRGRRRAVLLFEPNARPGSANRWLSRLADEAAIAFPSAAAGLACKAVVTGTPVRDEFFAVPEFSAAASPRLLVLGGSQGSAALNRELPGAVAALRARGAPLAVVHQTGERELEATRRRYRERGLEEAVRCEPFLEDVAGEMGRAWLVVSRAGAITLAEIRAAGRAALLIPLSIAAGHQVDNARAMVAAGAAAMVENGAADAAGLAAAIGGLLGDRARLEAMARSARAGATPGAAPAIADRLDRLVEAGRRR